MGTLRYAALAALCGGLLPGCAPKEEIGKYLYAVSGTCAVGNLTAQTAAKTIVRFNLENGTVDRTVIDYNSSTGDTPSIAKDYDADNLMVMVENTGGRRLEKVNKNSGERSIVTTFALTTVVRDFLTLSDGSYLVARTAAIEKYTSAHARMTVGANPWINAPGGACATSTGGMNRVVSLSNGKLIFANSTANQNRIGIISAAGYASAADCLAAQASPTIATQFPTAMLYIPRAGGASDVGHLLVAYASSTVAQNIVAQYTINETSNTISTVSTAYSNTGVLYGISAMSMDEVGNIYIANGSTAFTNTIEKFTYDPTSKTLTRVGNNPFIPETVNNRCINSMFIAE